MFILQVKEPFRVTDKNINQMLSPPVFAGSSHETAVGYGVVLFVPVTCLVNIQEHQTSKHIEFSDNGIFPREVHSHRRADGEGSLPRFPA